MLRNFPGNYFIENTRSILFYVMFLTFCIMGIIEILRFRYEAVQRLFIKLVGKLLKPYEFNTMHGSIPFFLGVAICTGFFAKEVAILSFLFLTVGDPCAAWFGSRFGRHKLFNGKSIEGLIAGILGASTIGIFFLILNMILEPENIFSVKMKTSPVLLLLSLFISVISGFVAELFSSSGFLDDNFLIPVTAGIVMSACLLFILKMDSCLVFFPIKDLIIPR